MPALSSPVWIDSLNLCTKHHLHLPCAECLTTQDKDIRVELVRGDIAFLKHHRHKRLKDLFPPEWKWMYPRILN